MIKQLNHSSISICTQLTNCMEQLRIFRKSKENMQVKYIQYRSETVVSQSAKLKCANIFPNICGQWCQKFKGVEKFEAEEEKCNREGKLKLKERQETRRVGRRIRSVSQLVQRLRFIMGTHSHRPSVFIYRKEKGKKGKTKSDRI